MVQSVEATIAERSTFRAPFEVEADIAQQIKLAMHSAPGWYANLSPAMRESLDQIATKMARIVGGGDASNVDNWHDIGGYAKLAEDRCQPQPLHKQLKLK